MKYEDIKSDVQVNTRMSAKCSEIMLTGYATSAFREATSDFCAATSDAMSAFRVATSDFAPPRQMPRHQGAVGKNSYTALPALVSMT